MAPVKRKGPPKGSKGGGPKVQRDEEERRVKRRKVVEEEEGEQSEASEDEFTVVQESSSNGLPSFPSVGGEEEDDEGAVASAKASLKKKKSGGFQSMGLSYPVYKAIINKGYKVPTPIQRRAIPVAMEGKDLVAMARTGSGKTAAFIIPMYEKLIAQTAKVGIKALVLSPTRELALQTMKFAKELGKYTSLKSCLLVGGDSIEDQFALIHSNPDIVVATPGRLAHLLVEMNFNLSVCEYIVYDEADRLFEMGFADQVKEIAHRLPPKRQTLLFSATLPKMLVEFAQAGLQDPVLIRLDVDTKLSEDLKLSFLAVRPDDKLGLLLWLLKQKVSKDQLTVVFVSTKHHVDYLREVLKAASLDCAFIYGTLDQTARKIQLAKFKNGKAPILLVTDVAARGIDVPLLDNVINYDFAPNPKLFVHRVGRVARAGRSGSAYSLVTPEELPYVLDLHLFLGKPFNPANPLIPLSQIEEKNGVYGAVPEIILGDMREVLKQMHASKADVEAAKNTANNAYKMFVKSRPKASAESAKRCKEMDPVVGIHPDFEGFVDDTAQMTAKLLNDVKLYKPLQTIFEVSRSSGQAVDVMKKKREMHAKAIERKQASRASQPTNLPTVAMETSTEHDIEAAFGVNIIDPAKRKRTHEDMEDDGKGHQDREHYIPHRPSDFHSESALALGDSFAAAARGEVMDMVGEDADEMKTKQQKMKWDRRKKKYVREDSDGKNKKITTESGRKILASYKTDIYKQWKEKHHVGRGDENIPQLEKGRARGRSDYARGPQKEKASKGGRVRSELKNKDQLLKQRKIKERKEQHVKEVRRKKAMNKSRGGGGGKKSKGRR